MNPSKDRDRKRRAARVGVESLEGRQLLTGGAGDTFAMIPGTITQAGGTASIQFTIDPKNFTLPRGSMALGIDVVADPSSSLKPLISSVDDPHGNLIPQTFHSIYDPHLSHLAVASGQGTSAVLTPVSFYPHDPTKPATYTVNVTAEGNTTGGFLLGFYLPGDANGDGTVDQADIQIIKSELGAKASSSNYTFDADTNRDGRIGKIDLAVARQNQGVTVNVSPIVAANLDPASDSGLQDRITNLRTVHFSGTATPGAAVTYTETASSGNNAQQTFSATADSNGNYNIMIPLADGVNQFQVTTKDGFGQSISGSIAPVTYSPTAPATFVQSITPVNTPTTPPAQTASTPTAQKPTG